MDNIAACIVTYNRKELLIKCLNSIISQTQTVQEIIIVNNCSTDGTKDMLFSKGYICPINEYTSSINHTHSYPNSYAVFIAV